VSRYDDQVARIGDLVSVARDDLTPTARILSIRDGAEIEDDEFEAARRRSLDEAREILWQRRIPRKFHQATLSDFSAGVCRDLEPWAQQPSGRNLLFLGPVGVGKTRAAIAACRPSHDRGLDVAFWPTAELLDAMRPSTNDVLEVADIADLDRLVLDDVGVERATDWTAERLDAVINRRWMDDLPTIATTNLEPDQLSERLGERTFSRLVGDAVVIRLSGDDRRRTRRT
jgi:DNA replication protein DnaC